MKAPKISFDSAKMQQLLLLHVEKIVLALVLVAVLWFVYQGVNLPKLEESKTPDKLTQEAARMTAEINNASHWELLKPERIVTHDVQGLVKQGQVVVHAQPTVMALHGLDHDAIDRRGSTHQPVSQRTGREGHHEIVDGVTRRPIHDDDAVDVGILRTPLER